MSQKVSRRFSEVSGICQTLVPSMSQLRDLKLSEEHFRGPLASSALCTGLVFIYVLLSPHRAVTINWSSCSLRSSTWSVWLLWWSPSSWWVSHPPEEDLGLDLSLTFSYLLRSSRWSSLWCCAVGSVTAPGCTRTRPGPWWSRPRLTSMSPWY